MKLKFDPSLDYQHAAVSAIADLFDGQATGTVETESGAAITDGLIQTEHGLGNAITLSNEQIFENLKAVQDANEVSSKRNIDELDFAVEMETGTGKTYVYLRSAFELASRYGFRKFIIVVPSVAIREGVLKSLDVMGEHFRALYDAMPFNFDVYDSKHPSRVRQFAGGQHLQFLVMNIQSFIKDAAEGETSGNIIYRDSDKMGGRPIDFLSQANPFVIIDEPQRMETDNAAAAIQRLNPAAVFRYSATHKDTRNLLFRLGPVEAFERQLVKRIEVDSVTADDRSSEAYVKFLKADHTKYPITAQIEIFQMQAGGPKRAKVTVKKGDTLFQKSKEHQSYTDLMISDIDATPDAEVLHFQNGLKLSLHEEMGGATEDVTKLMIERAVEHHLRKEREMKGRGIKVLTLFFLDRVADYRIYGDNGTSLGQVGKWFEEAYTELAVRHYKDVATYSADAVHDGYFSKDGKGKAKDTNGKTKADDDTYHLIMTHKERLLDPKTPLRFIFSHSALAEGWDNPNVFQICVLQAVGSTMRRRQQIGRGLRLPVNTDGERVKDQSVNRLVVISNEDYQTFASTLQSEYEGESGVKFGEVSRDAFAKMVRKIGDKEEALGIDGSNEVWELLRKLGYLDSKGIVDTDNFRPDDITFVFELPDNEDIAKPVKDELSRYLISQHVRPTRDKRTLNFRKQVHMGPEFKALWDRISQKTRYRVEFSTKDLIAKAVERIKGMEHISPLVISSQKVAMSIEHSGVAASAVLDRKVSTSRRTGKLPDILAQLQRETELTRSTLAEILKQCGKLDEFIGNPQTFILHAAREIQGALHDLMIDGIQYEKVDGVHYEMARFEQDAEKGITRYLNRLYEVKNKDRTLYDFVEYDSEVERDFAEALDINEHVKFFCKLPAWFVVDTPVGPYNPDWAFVTKRHDRLFFVRETKSTLERGKRRQQENQKTDCGKKHFKTLGEDYAVVTELAEVTF
jgi:type III restriction enzyme